MKRRSMFEFLLFLLFLLSSVVRAGETIKDQSLEKYEEFDITLSHQAFSSVNFTTYMSADENLWTDTKYMTPRLSGAFYYLNADRILYTAGGYLYCQDSAGDYFIFKVNSPSDFEFLGKYEDYETGLRYSTISHFRVHDDDYSYTIANSGGDAVLVIVDHSDKSSPFTACVFELDSYTGYSIFVEGDIGYICGEIYIYLIDLTDRTKPSILSQFLFSESDRRAPVAPQYCMGMVVKDKIMYYTLNSGSGYANSPLMIVDFTNHESPFLLFDLEADGVEMFADTDCIALRDDFLYVVSPPNLFVVNVSAVWTGVGNLTVKWQLDIVNYAVDSVLMSARTEQSRGSLYVQSPLWGCIVGACFGSLNLKKLSIEELEGDVTPTIIERETEQERLAWPATLYDENILFMPYLEQGIFKANFSEPEDDTFSGVTYDMKLGRISSDVDAEPSQMIMVGSGWRVSRIYVDHATNLLFAFDGQQSYSDGSGNGLGLEIFDITSPVPIFIRKIFLNYVVTAVSVVDDGDILYVYMNRFGIRVNSFNLSGFIMEDFEGDEYDFLISLSEVTSFDDGIDMITIEDFQIALVTGEGTGVGTSLHIYNISDPSNMTILSVHEGFSLSCCIGRILADMTFYRDLLQPYFIVYILSSVDESVYIRNITLPDFTVHVVGEISMSGGEPRGGCLDEDKQVLYLALGGEGLKIYDVSDPNVVTEIGSRHYDEAYGVSGNGGNTVFLADGVNGLITIDVSEPDDPRVISEMPTADGYDVYSKDNVVYYADGKSGIRVFGFDMNLYGKPDTFDYFCGETEITIRFSDTSEETTLETFSVFREDYCHSRGECLENFECECETGYYGEQCESWMCYSIDFKEMSRTCSGNGDCISPDICDCRGMYAGDKCEDNMLFYSVLIPIWSVLFVGFVICLCVGGCLCLFLSGCLLTVCAFAGVCLMLSLMGTIFKQKKGMKRFSQLKNFDLLLKEQELEDDETVAHLKFDKNLFEINYEDIRVIKILGEGGSNSIVYRAQWQGRVVAFKCFKTRRLLSTQDKFDEFEREVELMSSLSHPNIIRFFGACLNPPRVGIVMEYCPKGEILEFVSNFRKEYDQEYPIFEKIRLFIEISSSLEFIHSKNIIHRDIKSENVLISESDSAKLMDFGLSRLFRERMSKVEKTKRVGTSFYMSPEIVKTDSVYDQKCDIFSFSILICIVLSEISNPYEFAEGSKDMFQIEFKVANNPDFRPDLDALLKGKYEDEGSIIDWMKELIANCWEADPEKRHTAKEIRELLEKKVGDEEVQQNNLTSKRWKKKKQSSRKNVVEQLRKGDDVEEEESASKENEGEFKLKIERLEKTIQSLRDENEVLRQK